MKKVTAFVGSARKKRTHDAVEWTTWISWALGTVMT